jgi:hypothetical protein
VGRFLADQKEARSKVGRGRKEKEEKTKSEGERVKKTKIARGVT